jgi:predicted nucleic acid-binding protein
LRTFLDTNILSALWTNEESAALLGTQLTKAGQDGSVAVSAFTHAELFACPGASEKFIDEFFATAGIDVDSRLPDEIWALTRERFANYADRRRKTGKGLPRRILADFLIGAHARYRADRLMTMDLAFFERNFPELRLYPLVF